MSVRLASFDEKCRASGPNLIPHSKAITIPPSRLARKVGNLAKIGKIVANLEIQNDVGPDVLFLFGVGEK